MRTAMKVCLLILTICLIGCTSQQASNASKVILGNKRLTSIPDSVLEMKYLEYLDLSNRVIIRATSTFYRISLNDSANRIKRLPSELINMQKLRILLLGAVGLESIPDDFHALRNLDTLDLSFNSKLKVVDAVDELAQMYHLKLLVLTGVSGKKEEFAHLEHLLPNTKVVSSIDQYIEVVSSSAHNMGFTPSGH
jgi:Leucine-rich repeat (LRR) protein